MMRSFWVITALLLACGFSFAAKTVNVSEKEKALLARYDEYFKNLDLSYKFPEGKIAFKADGELRIVADFTGDGLPDVAQLYQYIGSKKRSSEWYLDLVILYSEGERVKHIIYPYSGRYLEESDEPILEYLSLQARGTVDLMPGKVELRQPGIMAYRAGQPAVTYYWNGKRFSQAGMGHDD